MLIIQHYGKSCACCGEANHFFLQLDHLNGGGTQQMENLGMRGGTFYAYLKRQGFPKKGYRILCANCNLSLGRYGMCPHSREGVQLAFF